jgi:hypothetical protein
MCIAEPGFPDPGVKKAPGSATLVEDEDFFVLISQKMGKCGAFFKEDTLVRVRLMLS